MARPATRALLALFASGALVACSVVWGIGDLPIEQACVGPTCVAAAPGDDVVTTDAPPDAAADVTDAAESEGGPAGCVPIDDAGFHDVKNPACWTTFDTTLVSPQAKGFVGTAFDGRYLYLTPDYNGATDGLVTRYDTRASFTSAASWTTFDLTTVNPHANGFQGAVFDGRFLYLVPGSNDVGPDGVVARFDTTASFSAATSWATFDTSTVNASAVFFQSGVFDGRYLYLVPFGFGTPSGLVVRYDTTAASGFTSSGSWTTFDATSINPSAAGFIGGVFDGRYVYLVPHQSSQGVDGVVVRYDTQFPFANATSWTTFDATQVDPRAAGLWGGAFDGRYVYFVPNDDGNAQEGLALRYDTATQNFTLTAAWGIFDTSSVATNAVGFAGGVYDGRYVYFAGNNDSLGNDGVVARYDTTANFALAASWGAFDTTTLEPTARAYIGGAFDGRYVYLTPFVGSTVARFDARSSAIALPAFYRGGSFF